MPATTGGLTPIRGNLVYIGAAKQSLWDTAVAPQYFFRWLDGTDPKPVPRHQMEREGDTSPDISLVYKTGQWWEIKIVEYIRPITAGFCLQALHGTSSDTYTAPTTSGAFQAAVAVGATSFSINANLGTVGTLYLNFSPGFTSTNYEVLQVDLTTKTGAGPNFTYTLANGATFRQAHAQNDVITSVATHVLTRQPLTYDAYSLEIGIGGGLTNAKAFRLQDCVCYQVDLESMTGRPLKLTHSWYGALSAIQGSLATISQEGQNLIGTPGGPLVHNQAQGNWTVDGATTGNAATVKGMKISLKNSTAPDVFQTEGLSPAYFQPGNIDRSGQLDVIFNSWNQYLATYYGSASAGTGAQDSYLTGFGSFSTQWVADAINSLKIALPSVAYTAAPLTPKLDGKSFEQSIAFTANKAQPGQVPHTFTLTNSWASQY